MLIDAALLPLKKLADEGDPEALVKMSDIFYEGRGTAVNYSLSKKYLVMLNHYDPDYLWQIGYGYGSLLYLIGDVCSRLEEWSDAKYYYQKAIDYLRDSFTKEFADREIRYYKLESLIEQIERTIASQ